MSIRKLLLALSIFYSVISFAQVGVGTEVPNSSTMLDVVASDKGVLLPRVQLNNSTDAITIVPQNEVGLVVYNIAAIADIDVGYHFWDGAKWVAMRTEGILSGTGNPNDNGTNGGAGDIYVDESTGEIYVHDGDDWILFINETLTVLSVTTNDNGTPDTADDFDELIYTDENGDENVVDISSLVTASETLTVLSIATNDNGTPGDPTDDFDELIYTDEHGNENVVDISSLITTRRYVASYTAASGDIDFATPHAILELDNIDAFRNGARIDFTQVDANTIKLDLGALTGCFAGDEIRIVQLK